MLCMEPVLANVLCVLLSVAARPRQYSGTFTCLSRNICATGGGVLRHVNGRSVSANGLVSR